MAQNDILHAGWRLMISFLMADKLAAALEVLTVLKSSHSAGESACLEAQVRQSMNDGQAAALVHQAVHQYRLIGNWDAALAICLQTLTNDAGLRELACEMALLGKREPELVWVLMQLYEQELHPFTQTAYLLRRIMRLYAYLEERQLPHAPSRAAFYRLVQTLWPELVSLCV